MNNKKVIRLQKTKLTLQPGNKIRQEQTLK